MTVPIGTSAAAVAIAFLMGVCVGRRSKRSSKRIPSAQSQEKTAMAAGRKVVSYRDLVQGSMVDGGTGSIETIIDGTPLPDVTHFLTSVPNPVIDDHKDVTLNPALLHLIQREKEEEKKRQRLMQRRLKLERQGISAAEIMEKMAEDGTPCTDRSEKGEKKRGLMVLAENGWSFHASTSSAQHALQDRRRKQRLISHFLHRTQGVEVQPLPSHPPHRRRALSADGKRGKLADEVAASGDWSLYDRTHARRVLYAAREGRTILRKYKESAEYAKMNATLKAHRAAAQSSKPEASKSKASKPCCKRGVSRRHAQQLDPAALSQITAELSAGSSQPPEVERKKNYSGGGDEYDDDDDFDNEDLDMDVGSGTDSSDGSFTSASSSRRSGKPSDESFPSLDAALKQACEASSFGDTGFLQAWEASFSRPACLPWELTLTGAEHKEGADETFPSTERQERWEFGPSALHHTHHATHHTPHTQTTQKT